MKGGLQVIQHDQLLDFKGFPMANNELSQWVEHVTRQLIEDLPEGEEDAPPFPPDSAGSSMACQDGILAALTDESRPAKMARFSRGDNNEIVMVNKCESKGEDEDDDGMRLISLLLECTVAISVDNLGEAHTMLLELTQMASPYGASCAERIVAYFATAMTSRVTNSWLGMCAPLVNLKSLYSSFQVFNSVSPFIKFAHFTSNQTILEALHGHRSVHIVDLDIMQGLQWPALFHILATRAEGPPLHIKMTGLGPSMELLVETGKHLWNFAKRLGLSFEFHPMAKKFGEIDDVSVLQINVFSKWRFWFLASVSFTIAEDQSVTLRNSEGLNRGETVAVHWLHHSLYDATGPDRKTMNLLRQISPTVITLVEQEISHAGSFLDRFVGSLHYYSTVFDSVGASLPSDDRRRHTVEHGLLGREISNIVAIGGPGRSGEEKYRQWRSELIGNGFLQVGMSRNSIAQAQLILNMFPPHHGYSLVQGDGTLRLGWKETTLYTASAWTSPIPNPR